MSKVEMTLCGTLLGSTSTNDTFTIRVCDNTIDEKQISLEDFRISDLKFLIYHEIKYKIKVDDYKSLKLWKVDISIEELNTLLKKKLIVKRRRWVVSTSVRQEEHHAIYYVEPEGNVILKRLIVDREYVALYSARASGRYIYGGILSLNEQDVSDIIKVLAAADKLCLQELLQQYLIENKSELMKQHFELTYQTSFQSNNLLRLQQFCTDLIANSPEKIFKSFDLISLSENSLIQLIKRDDLQMKEIEV
ncbi:hypothetical protein RclHR1_04840009 [Rhizophagus clarus]|uniref:Uncharacterized protein n=1 Tax=Rhizophagus clarus TaxID=94130 RepID=A0A2Z6RJI3_9GLOM|nr:hypothetical protein RclHR1_04840009 [Rhizophagus clarus]